MRSKLVVVSVVVLAVVAWMGLASTMLAAAPAVHLASNTSPTAAVTPAALTGASAGSHAPAKPALVQSPATTAGATISASELSQLPASERSTPWIASLAHTGTKLHPLSSLPNLNLLEHPVTSVVDAVNPGYVAQPAPLGLADYGLGATTYSYNTSHVLGQIVFNTPPNVTDTGSSNVIEPAVAGQHLGEVGSVYEFGIQLNTVATNISIPGSDEGFFWTQNVVNWNDTGIHFVSDTFNLSAGSDFYLAPGTIVSACGYNAAGVDTVLEVYGGVFQCVGGTIPLSPASYPVTLQLYNNATINAENQTVVSYGYWIDEAGTGQIYSGVSDAVVFNNTAGTLPPNPPGFSVDGFAPAPAGLLRDSEIVLVGDIGGDNSVFRSINGSVNLEISNLSSGGWKNVPSAYNFGGDTGETSTGIADYWTPAHTLEINQGPSMLYGLWNAIPSVSVASGDIHLAGSITPSYGFVFVSNTAPVADPFASGAAADNFSWLPTNNAGDFSTYLPPTTAPWTSQYYVQGFADGSSEVNGTPVTGTTTGYSLVLPLSPGSLEAPLYAFSNAQAQQLAVNVTGSGTAPYDFSDLTVNVNASFDHLNDYQYPSFEVFMTQGVTTSFIVNNVTEGQDSPAGNLYFWDGSTGGLLFPPPIVLGPYPNYTAQINIYGGLDDQVTNETILALGDGDQGGGIVLWQDTGVEIRNAIALWSDIGIFLGDSQYTQVINTTVENGYGIEDIGSNHTTAEYLFDYGGFGVEGYASWFATYSQIYVSFGEGFLTGLDLGIPYYDLPGTHYMTVENLTVGIASIGADLAISNDTYFGNVSETGGGFVAIEEEGTNVTGIDNLVANSSYYGALFFDTNWTNVSDSQFNFDDNGLVLENSTNSTLTADDFTQNVGYAVIVLGGEYNLVFRNYFVGNDGSTLVYNPATIQAYSTPGNSWDAGVNLGNYWADWHSFNTVLDRLNPYPISNGVADQYPLGTGPTFYTVTFVESGLPTEGKSWSVSFAGEVVKATAALKHPTALSISFSVPAGIWQYLITGPSGYRVAFVGGYHGSDVVDASLTVAIGGVNGDGIPDLGVAFVAGSTTSLSFHEVGLKTGTTWCVELAAEVCSKTATVVYKNLTPDSYYFYVIESFPGATTLVKTGGVWTPTSGAGSLYLSKGTTVQIRYAYPVVFEETGLATGTTWTVSSQGQSNSTDGSANYLNLTNGTDPYTVHAVKGYTITSELPSKKVSVSGGITYVLITFTVKPGHVPAAVGPTSGATVADVTQANTIARVG